MQRAGTYAGNWTALVSKYCARTAADHVRTTASQFLRDNSFNWNQRTGTASSTRLFVTVYRPPAVFQVQLLSKCTKRNLFDCCVGQVLKVFFDIHCVVINVLRQCRVRGSSSRSSLASHKSHKWNHWWTLQDHLACCPVLNQHSPSSGVDNDQGLFTQAPSAGCRPPHRNIDLGRLNTLVP